LALAGDEKLLQIISPVCFAPEGTLKFNAAM
jgi:hypothetical protein